MTVVTFPLGLPRPALSRGGDCYAHDLSTGPITERPHVHGPHRFRLPEHCAVQNGLLRVAVNAGSPPSLTMQVRQGPRTVGDTYVDTYVDLYGGAVASAEWCDAGVVTIDSPSVGAVLTGVRLVEVTPEHVIVKLLAPLIGDAFVGLYRGWRSIRIQHGDPRDPVTVARRVRLTGSPSPTGTASAGRVEESSPAVAGLLRFVASVEAGTTTDAGAFSVSVPASSSAVFGAGAGTDNARDRPYDLHRQLGDASRPVLLVREIV